MKWKQQQQQQSSILFPFNVLKHTPVLFQWCEAQLCFKWSIHAGLDGLKTKLPTLICSVIKNHLVINNNLCECNIYPGMTLWIVKVCDPNTRVRFLHMDDNPSSSCAACFMCESHTFPSQLLPFCLMLPLFLPLFSVFMKINARAGGLCYPAP